MRKKIVAGNWKMNKNFQEGNKLANEIASKMSTLDENQEVILVPSFINLASIAEIINDSELQLGAQDCHIEAGGAYTGEVSAPMIKSIGASYCLVGHSERRAYNFEDDKDLDGKIKALLSVGIRPIFCCGELLEDRKTNSQFDVISQQLELLWTFSKEEFKRIVIAYEPVWAIGTGETASAEQAQEVHAFIRKLIKENINEAAAKNTSILYGGSCKPSNAKEIFAKEDVDGGLIGGAALNAEDFIGIVNSHS